MSGPAPTPSAILANRGSWRAKQRQQQGEPAAPAGKPTCPKWLGKEAKAEWRRQIKALAEMGVLARCDGAALAVFCEAWGEFREASTAVEKYGLIFKDKESGQLKRNPVLKIRNDAADRVLKLAGQFGFTPAARTRLRAPPKEDPADDPLEALLRDGGSNN